MLTSVLLDERNIPQPAFGTLLPCRKGEGAGMRVDEGPGEMVDREVLPYLEPSRVAAKIKTHQVSKKNYIPRR
jgi:hypothetical protein